MVDFVMAPLNFMVVMETGKNHVAMENIFWQH